MRKISTRNARRGVAAAELAYIAPVLLLLVLGCVDFGRYAYTNIALTNATRSGAGYGAVSPYTTATYSNWQAQARQEVIDEMSQVYGYDGSKLTVIAEAVTESGGLWRAEVTASYPFQPLIPWPGIPSSMTMTQKAVMRATR